MWSEHLLCLADRLCCRFNPRGNKAEVEINLFWTQTEAPPPHTTLKRNPNTQTNSLMKQLCYLVHLRQTWSSGIIYVLTKRKKSVLQQRTVLILTAQGWVWEPPKIRDGPSSRLNILIFEHFNWVTFPTFTFTSLIRESANPKIPLRICILLFPSCPLV